MRFFVDQNLAPRLATELIIAGHDAIHTGSIGLDRATDREILAKASEDGRVIISADTDFRGTSRRKQCKYAFGNPFPPGRGKTSWARGNAYSFEFGHYR